MTAYVMPWRRAAEAPAQTTEIALTLRDGVPVAHSRSIAAQFDKQHGHVLRDIKELLTSPILERSVALTNAFFRTAYMAENGQSQEAYEITRPGFELLCMGWTGDKAFRFKVSYIDAFHRMEAQLRAAPVADPIARLEHMAESLLDAVRVLLAREVKPAIVAPALPAPADPAPAAQPRRRRRTQEEMDAARDQLWGESRFMSAKAWTREHGHNAAWNKSLGILASKIAKKEGIKLGVERRKDYKGEPQYVNTYPQGLLSRAYAGLLT